DEEMALLHGGEPDAFARDVAEDDVREGADEQRVFGGKARRLRTLVERGGEGAAGAPAERPRLVVVDQVEDEVGLRSVGAREPLLLEDASGLLGQLAQSVRGRLAVDRIVPVHREESNHLHPGRSGHVQAVTYDAVTCAKGS